MTSIRSMAASLFVFAALLGVACQRTPPHSVADTLLTHGSIYTAEPAGSMAEAVAFKGDSIVFVGTSDAAEAWIGAATQVVDLAGRLVLPGLHDVHIHPSGIIEFDRCDLANQSLSLAQISAFVKDCIARFKTPAGETLLVELWNFAGGNEPDEDHPTIRAALDAASSRHGIYLKGSDGHHGGANSVLLGAARDADGSAVGLSESTITSHFSALRELIGVDATGEPDGYLTEDATSLVLPGGIDEILSNDQIVTEAHQVPKRLNSVGITSIQDAAASPGMLPLYDKLDADGALTLRVALAQFYDPQEYVDGGTGRLDRETLLGLADALREKYRGHPLIRADGVKLFADGVIEGNPFSDPPTLPSGAMLRPYKQPIFAFDGETLSIQGYVDPESDPCKAFSATGDPGNADAVAAFRAEYGHHPRQCIVSNGVLESPEALLYEFVDLFHANDYTVHIHAIGDRAVHVAADAIARARATHGAKGKPHGLAHIQIVHPDDIAKIGEQGLYLAFTYAWIEQAQEYDSTVMPFIDEVANLDEMYTQDHYTYRQSYPASSLKAAGGILVGGSDAPVDTRDPRPFVNIERAVTRANGDGAPYNAAEGIGIRDAIAAYTINGAAAMRQADITGSIEVGKKADLIVLDRNIIELAESGRATEISGTRVLRTYFDGVLVHRAE